MEETIHQFLSRIGTKGGNAVLKKYGKEHYRRIIKKRWDAVKAVNKLAEKSKKGSK